MDIILLLVGAWWLSGVLGCRKRKPKRRKSSIWKPDLDVYDWEQHQKSNRNKVCLRWNAAIYRTSRDIRQTQLFA